MNLTADHWPFAAAGLVQLNHGSFGACPKPVLSAQTAWRARFQANPTGFVHEEVDEAWKASRSVLARFVGADVEGLVFVRNATEGVNTVLASFPLSEGDEILVTNHGYGACTNAAIKWGKARGASVVAALVPFPLSQEDEVMQAVLNAITPRTKLALLDHITSPTALIFPITRLVRELKARGIAVLVDGAHAPGQVPLDVQAVGADFYTGNCHKWLCAPPGTAFLWVAPAWRESIEPLVISHGYSDISGSRPRLHRLFDWTGTADFTGVLCLPELLAFLSSLHEAGIEGIMKRNRALALQARQVLGWQHAPESMVGSMVATPWPAGHGEALQKQLLHSHKLMLWTGWLSAPHTQMLRVSAYMYNNKADYEALTKLF